jgi:hypothetical protein
MIDMLLIDPGMRSHTRIILAQAGVVNGGKNKDSYADFIIALPFCWLGTTNNNRRNKNKILIFKSLMATPQGPGEERWPESKLMSNLWYLICYTCSSIFHNL